MSVFHLNGRSLKNKYEVSMFLNSLEFIFDALAFTETWFTPDCEEVFFPNYKSIMMSRDDRRGGGVPYIYKITLTVTLYLITHR